MYGDVYNVRITCTVLVLGQEVFAGDDLNLEEDDWALSRER